MDIDKPIKLRPRFRHYTDLDKEYLLSKIKTFKTRYKSNFKIKLSGQHIWIHHPKAKEKIYTPHLHLELVENDYDQPDKLLIKGLYSPNSSYWTLFMFLHFLLAVVFIGVSILAYTKSILDEPYWLYVYILICIAAVWVSLYFFARYNRTLGLKQAIELEKVFKEWVRSEI